MDGSKILIWILYYLELQVVGQDEAALQALHDVVLSKRSRSNPITVMEPIMLKYVVLCVELRKGKMVKEGLHQYRNIAQNTSVNSIEVLIQQPIFQFN
jgi:translation initiation factor 3 subunit A